MTETHEEILESLRILQRNTDDFFKVILGIIVFLMQCGFAFLEAGAVRRKNTVNIITNQSIVRRYFICKIAIQIAFNVDEIWKITAQIAHFGRFNRI